MVVGIFSVAAILPSVFAFAQTAEPELSSLTKKLEEQVLQLQIQIKNLQPELGEIKGEIVFTKTLGKGEDNDEVRRLQELLKQFPDMYPEGLVTGYYGSFTEDAIKRFQMKYGIVDSGSAETTGFGLVGPKTREKLNELAGIGIVTPPAAILKVTVCHVPPEGSNNKQTLEVSQSALEEHRAHGDTLGACLALPSPAVSTPSAGAGVTTTPAVPVAVSSTTASSVATSTEAAFLPPTLSAVRSTDGKSISVTWTSVPYADMYRLYRRVAGDANWAEVAVFSSDITAHTDRPVFAIYEYYMKACRSSGICPSSSSLVIVDLLTLAAQPISQIKVPSSIALTPAPTISNVHVSDITSTSVKVTWVTDILSNSQASYGTVLKYTAYDSQRTLLDFWVGDENRCDGTMVVTVHCIQLKNLVPGTHYYFVVLSMELNGGNTESKPFEFTTLSGTSSFSPDAIKAIAAILESLTNLLQSLKGALR